MKIILETATGLVIYAGENLVLTDDGATNGDWLHAACTPEGHTLVEDVELPVNWCGGHYTYEDGEWILTDEGIAAQAARVVAERKARVPAEVTMRQARLALLQANLLAIVATAIAGLPSPQKEAATIEWEYSQTVARNRPFVLMLGAALGLSEEDLDDLFILAATL